MVMIIVCVGGDVSGAGCGGVDADGSIVMVIVALIVETVIHCISIYSNTISNL